MDWSKLSNQDLDQFISAANQTSPVTREEKIVLAEQLFERLSNEGSSDFTVAVVDLYLSSLEPVQTLPFLTLDEVTTQLVPLSEQIYLDPPNLDRLVHILQLAGKLEVQSIDTITSEQLQPFTKTVYPLSSLICGQFHYPHQFTRVFDSVNPCTLIGDKIATSLIKVAARRIFSNPYQSILEPIVNSLDAYAEKRGLPSVGKFGLGFYSLLYWLIDHPDRKLTLESFSDDGHWIIEIYEQNQVLLYIFDILGSSDERGVNLELDLSKDPIPSEEFSKQLEKLTEAQIAQIWVNDHPLNHTSSEDRVIVKLTDHHIQVRDQATGIRLSTLFGSLLVPSVSEKKLVSSLKNRPMGVNPRTRIEEAEQNQLLITVGSVGVVNLTFTTPVRQKYRLILDLSLAVRLPSSRDDILIQQRVYSELEANLDQLLSSSAEIQTLVPFERALQDYQNLTGSKENKRFLSNYLSQLDKKINALGKVRYHHDYDWLYQQIDPDRYIAAITYSVELLEASLFEQVEFENEVFYGKSVAMVSFVPFLTKPRPEERLVSSSGLTTNGGTARILFVNSEFVEATPTALGDLPVLELNDTLLPLSLDYTTSLSGDIQTILNIFEGKLSTTTVSLLANFLLRYRKLSTYFTLGFTNRGAYSDTDRFFTVTVYYLYQSALKLGQDPNYQVVRYLMEWFRVIPRMVPKTTAYGAGQPSIFLHSYISFADINLTAQGVNSSLQSFLSPQNSLPPEAIERLTNFAIESMIWSMNKSVELDKPRLYNIFEYDFPLSILLYPSGHITYTILFQAIDYCDNFYEYLTMIQIARNTLYHLVLELRPLPKHDPLKTITKAEQRRIDRVSKEIHAIVSQLEATLFENFPSIIQIIRDEYDTSTLDQILGLTLLKPDRDVFINRVGRRIFEQLRLVSSYDLQPVPISPVMATPVYQYRLNLSSLISSSFQDDLSRQNFLEDLAEFQSSERSPIEDLQVIEVAINENTTKSFWEAVLTELAQNSLDALRISGVKGEIKVKLQATTNEEEQPEVRFSMSDPVGIPPEAYLSLILPFVSTKGDLRTPDGVPLTTGEIGSGFFNVYRESSLVEIESCFNGYEVQIIDFPIRDERGRTVDLDKTVSVNPNSSRTNGTTITIVVPVNSNQEALDMVGSVIFQTRTLLGLIPVEIATVTMNEQPIQIETIEISRSPLAVLRMSKDNTFNSMVLTRAVPFRPMTEYLAFSTLFPVSVRENLLSDLVLDLQSGFTPVSSRTTLNLDLSLQDRFNSWFAVGVYRFLLSKYLRLPPGTAADSYIPNSSSSSYDQLHLADHLDPDQIRVLSEWLLYSTFPEFPVPLASYFNQAIDFLIANQPPLEVITSRGYIEAPKSILARDWKIKMPREQKEVVIHWFENKGRHVTLAQRQTTVEVVERPRPPEILTRISQAYVDVYWKIGHELEQNGTIVGSKFKEHSSPPKTNWGNYGVISFSGAYSPHNHAIRLNFDTINSNPQQIEELTRHLEALIGTDLPTFLNNWLIILDDDLFKGFFGLGYPAKTFIHEIAHAWRSEAHDVKNVHDSFYIQIGNRPAQRYSFDEAANGVALEILARNFSEQLWARLN